MVSTGRSSAVYNEKKVVCAGSNVGIAITHDGICFAYSEWGHCLNKCITLCPITRIKHAGKVNVPPLWT